MRDLFDEAELPPAIDLDELDPETLRRALEQTFDYIEQGASPAEAIERTVRLFEGISVEVRHIDATVAEVTRAPDDVGDVSAWLGAIHIEDRVASGTVAINSHAGLGEFDTAAAEARRLAAELRVHNRQQSWMSGRGLER